MPSLVLVIILGLFFLVGVLLVRGARLFGAAPMRGDVAWTALAAVLLAGIFLYVR